MSSTAAQGTVFFFIIAYNVEKYLMKNIHASEKKEDLSKSKVLKWLNQKYSADMSFSNNIKTNIL